MYELMEAERDIVTRAYDEANLRTSWTPRPALVRSQIDMAYQRTLDLPEAARAAITLRCTAALALQKKSHTHREGS